MFFMFYTAKKFYTLYTVNPKSLHRGTFFRWFQHLIFDN